MTQSKCIFITLLISSFCLLGDYFLKRASQSPFPFRTGEFALGTMIFAVTAIGWVIVLPKLKLGVVGVIYGVSTVLFMALLGWLVFGERLHWHEGLGLVLGVVSIALLSRFA